MSDGVAAAGLNTPGNSSDAGSPMAGAIDPSALRNIKVDGSPIVPPANGAPRRISELGSAATQGAQGMVLLPELFGNEQPNTQQQQQQKPVVAKIEDNPEAQALALEQAQSEPENVAEVLGDEASLQLQDYQQFVDSPDIDIEKFGDKVLWYDADGKGEMVPMRLSDVPDAILRFNDYQRKTTEVAQIKREFERRDNGRKQWVEDVVSGDAERGLRAWRAIGGGETMRSMVLAYVKEQADLEALPPSLQQRFLRQQQIEDRAFFLERQNRQLQSMHQQRQEQQTQQQGADAPDIQHVQKTLTAALPETYQLLGIKPGEYNAPAFQYHLEQVFASAAAGERNDDGTWKVAPTLQRGRTPSRTLIRQLVQEVRAQTNSTVQKYGKPTKPRRGTPPPTLLGSGPAADPGQRGNIGQPQRMRFSDMGRQPAK
jgi:hypothetical protein